MWVKPEDYFNFAKNCRVTYFAFDISKLMDELFGESASISGITLDHLNGECVRIYNQLLESCPPNTPFADYVHKKIPEEYGDDTAVLQSILIDINLISFE